MTVHSHIFREYDIRGDVGTELTDQFAHLLGRAYATLAKEHNRNNIAIGYDCRVSSPGFAQALARGINDEGLDCCITGMGPTPQLYYAVFSKGFGGGIQVTGSHNPPSMNGFKILLGEETLASEQIQNLKERCLKLENSKPSTTKKGALTESDIQESYINEIITNCKPHMGSRKLKVVVDAGNGVGGMVGPAVLKALGCELIELYCNPDGTFPNHHPDPTVLENIEELIHKVRENKADFGIGWDGDADRIGVVDQNGEVIFGDMLTLLYARSILSTTPGATIIGDVKCSSKFFADIKKHGGIPVMSKTGHSLIKKKLKEVHAALAGEMSGHIVFKHRYYGFDDALYSSARLVEIMSKTSTPLSELLSDLPSSVSTPEIRVDCAEQLKFKIASLAPQYFKEFKVDTTDGARIEFENGWGLVRASNTQPVLVMRFEALSANELETYKKLVFERIEKIKQALI